MKLTINNVDLGELDDELVNKIIEKYEEQDITDIAISFMSEIIGDEADSMNVDQIIKRARFMKNNSGYDTIAEMVSVYMKRDIRPATEICKNCDSYNNQFCVYHLQEVDPFSKGNSCWKEKREMDNVTHIAEGYVKYGKEPELPIECDIPEDNIEQEDDNLISFSRPRWIVKDDEPEELLSIADLNDMMDEVMSRDPDELREELDKEAAEHNEGIQISTEEVQIIINNIDRFVMISGYLYSIWLTVRKHGIFSIRNVIEETEETDDMVIDYINNKAEDIIEGTYFDNITPDPLEYTMDDILIAYSNYIMSGIVGAVNPNRMKAVVKCFVPKDEYQNIMDRITECTKRYYWLEE